MELNDNGPPQEAVYTDSISEAFQTLLGVISKKVSVLPEYVGKKNSESDNTETSKKIEANLTPEILKSAIDLVSGNFGNDASEAKILDYMPGLHWGSNAAGKASYFQNTIEKFKDIAKTCDINVMLPSQAKASMKALENPDMSVGEGNVDILKDAQFVYAPYEGNLVYTFSPSTTFSTFDVNQIKIDQLYVPTDFSAESAKSFVGEDVSLAVQPKKSPCLKCGNIVIDDTYCPMCKTATFKYNELDFNWVINEAQNLCVSPAYLVEYLNNTDQKADTGWKTEHCQFCGIWVATKATSNYVCHQCYDKQYKQTTSVCCLCDVTIPSGGKYCTSCNIYHDIVVNSEDAIYGDVPLPSKKGKISVKENDKLSSKLADKLVELYDVKDAEFKPIIKAKKTLKVGNSLGEESAYAKLKAKAKVYANAATGVNVAITPLKEPPSTKLKFVNLGKDKETFHAKNQDGTACGKKSKTVYELSEADNAMVAHYLGKFICPQCIKVVVF